MNFDVIERLTSKDSKHACAFADGIARECAETDKWYEYFYDFASLLKHPNSLVRNRAFTVLAANMRWDKEDRFSEIAEEYLSHITDEKPITARQCIKSLATIGASKPRYIPMILFRLESADLTGYKDSMRPLIERDIAETAEVLKHITD